MYDTLHHVCSVFNVMYLVYVCVKVLVCVRVYYVRVGSALTNIMKFLKRKITFL